VRGKRKKAEVKAFSQKTPACQGLVGVFFYSPAYVKISKQRLVESNYSSVLLEELFYRQV
jgi:hypothetical protein